MVDKNRGQLLLLGGLAMAIVFLAVIPLSNSLVVTESAATSETVREIDRTANRQANIERDIRTLANRTDAVNNTDAFNASLQNYSLYRTQVSGQRSGVYVNATLNVSASARGTSGTDFGGPSGSSNDWDLANNSTRIYDLNVTIEESNPTPSNALTVNISSESSDEYWTLRAYNETPNNGPIVVNTSTEATAAWSSSDCVGDPPIEIDIQAGTCTVEGTTHPLPENYTEMDGPYTVAVLNGNNANPVGSYRIAATGNLASGPSNIAVPYVDVVYNGPDVRYERTLGLTGSQASVSSSSSTAGVSPPAGAVYTGTGSGVLNITGNNSATSTIITSSTPTGLGPASDIDSDGDIEVPYVDGSGNLRLVTSGGSETLLADSSNNIYQPKTRLAVGTWNGSDPSVFYANDSSAISRVEPGESPVLVADPGNDANSVVGPADIDGDNTDELVFADGSQTLRYLEDDGSTETLPAGGSGISLGSSVGIGSGAIADYDGDDSEEVAAVDGGNDLVIADASGSETIDSPSYTASGDEPQPTQSPVTAADVDGDGTDELVYVESRSGDGGDYIRYLDNIQSYDDPGDTIEIKNLTDASGDRISGDPETGAT